jgi:peptide/nickel transport system permease protein
MRVRLFSGEGGLQAPFVYGYTKSRNPETFRMEYQLDLTQKYPIKFFIRGREYKLLGIFKTKIHLFGVEEPGALALFGTDNLGRDIFSRTMIATRISSSIGLISIFLSLILGLIIGAVSALAGGIVDLVIQKIIEVLISIPSIPLWMGLAAALPQEWSPLMVYFSITVILALRNWIGVARVVRGRFLSLKEEDFIMASRNFGAQNWYVIRRHMIPNFMSYVIVSVTLSIPSVIIAETALSFLGIGLRPPVVSWGVLLQSAQNLHSIVDYTWTLIPATFVIIIVLAYNFAGDGLRDAADPYKRK